MTIDDAIVVRAFEALKTVDLLPLGQVVPHKVWQECLHVEFELFRALREAGVHVKLAHRETA